MEMYDESWNFRDRAIFILKNIPEGRVISYGAVAALAGSPRAARQVVRILKTSPKDNLPWHRVISSRGQISITETEGFMHQKMLLEMEGIESDSEGRIDMSEYMWRVGSISQIQSGLKEF